MRGGAPPSPSFPSCIYSYYISRAAYLITTSVSRTAFWPRRHLQPRATQMKKSEYPCTTVAYEEVKIHDVGSASDIAASSQLP